MFFASGHLVFSTSGLNPARCRGSPPSRNLRPQTHPHTPTRDLRHPSLLWLLALLAFFMTLVPSVILAVFPVFAVFVVDQLLRRPAAAISRPSCPCPPLLPGVKWLMEGDSRG